MTHHSWLPHRHRGPVTALVGVARMVDRTEELLESWDQPNSEESQLSQMVNLLDKNGTRQYPMHRCSLQRRFIHAS